jgi:endo-1,4-beta-xylanase
MFYRRPLVFVAVLAAAIFASAQDTPTLKDAYKNDFYIGAAINTAQITGQDKSGDALIASQFNSITPDNALKWEKIHPQPDKYDFALADQYVAFGQEHHMFIVGHNLVWHSQVPAWVFRDAKGNLLSREALLARMHDHISTVVGRYKGRIQSWDVVNEALNEDGTLRQSLWFKIIGPDYIEKAFQYAHEADPAAQLTYNDYNLENPAKCKGAVALVKKLQADGIPITTVGIQGHIHLNFPAPEQEDAAITALEVLGVKVAITEFDIDVLPSAGYGPTADVSLKVKPDATLNPYVNGLPADVQQQLADRYAAFFRVFLKHRGAMSRVTFWGVTDAGSWLNNWPVVGRTSYPLLFDSSGQPKPAYQAVIRVASEK